MSVTAEYLQIKLKTFIDKHAQTGVTAQAAADALAAYNAARAAASDDNGADAAAYNDLINALQDFNKDNT